MGVTKTEVEVRFMRCLRKLTRTDVESLLNLTSCMLWIPRVWRVIPTNIPLNSIYEATGSSQCIETGTKSPFANRNTFWSTTHVNSLTRNHVLWHLLTNTESRNHQEAPKQDYMELRHFTYWTSTNGDAENFWQGRRPARGRFFSLTYHFFWNHAANNHFTEILSKIQCSDYYSAISKSCKNLQNQSNAIRISCIFSNLLPDIWCQKIQRISY